MVLYCFLIHASSSIRVGNEELETVEVFKLLGVHAQRDLKWNTHIDEIVTKASKRLCFLRACRKANLPTEVGLTTYITKIRITHLGRHPKLSG